MVHSARTERNAKLLSLLPPEARLLLLCAAGDSAGDDIAAVARGTMSWEAVCRLAQREGAEPMVHECVERFAGLAANDSALAGLRRLARVSAFKMNYLHQRLRQTVNTLAEAGIDCLLLKGAALATSVYASAQQRPMIDIDLLVHRSQARAAMTILLETGWAWQAGKDRDRPVDSLHHLPALLDARGMEISLELHTSVFPTGSPFIFPPETIWGMAGPSRSGVGSIPHPMHMLLHTCTHLVWSHQMRKHACRAFRDIEAVIQKYPIDWDGFAEAAKQARAQTCCYWTFRLARSLVGVGIPDEMLRVLRPPLPRGMLNTLERHFALILLPSSADCPSIRLRRVMWSAGILPRWSGHNVSRPWDVLKLTPEGIMARGSSAASARTGIWKNYCQSLVLGASREGPISA